jgi:hypothetical protein
MRTTSNTSSSSEEYCFNGSQKHETTNSKKRVNKDRCPSFMLGEALPVEAYQGISAASKASYGIDQIKKKSRASVCSNSSFGVSSSIGSRIERSTSDADDDLMTIVTIPVRTKESTGRRSMFEKESS